MDLRPITDKQRSQYDKLVTHVIQSWEWGKFRKSLGIPLLRYGLYKNGKLQKAFQLTLHKIPFTSQYVGYLPKGPFPNKDLAEALKKLGKEYNCAFIKVEPDVVPAKARFAKRAGIQLKKMARDLLPSPKPLFTKYNFIIDLTKSEEELLKNMHPKTRYNIKIAQRNGVEIQERTDDEAFEIYLKLYFETTKRQGYHGHNKEYHQKVWETLKKVNMARLLIAFYRLPNSDIRHPITAWMLLNFKDTLYYPYGGSSLEYKNVMASNLVAWQAIKLGKKLGLKKFDVWGALGPDAKESDPWYGFHKFKQGYGGELVEYIGTYDLVFNWPLYLAFTAIDKLTPLKVFLLRLFGK
ncbi:peptidoglycan bridge formation glycyltransferase FemA/FemB family protein [Candidatus Microgenomates bacterium]|nr:peptidoglycan bridge formation glycyltransferase FemA/FemB family protein [Candidatus Microgenomates bacterium]